MLNPTKYLDLNTCVLYIASLILEELEKLRVLKFHEIDEKITNKVGDSGRHNLMYALSFLYVTGIIEYAEQTDSIYIHKQKWIEQ